MANIIFGKFIEVSRYSFINTYFYKSYFIYNMQDVKKRMDIRYYSSFEEMDSSLKFHPDSVPRIINENLVQVKIVKVYNFSLFFYLSIINRLL